MATAVKKTKIKKPTFKDRIKNPIYIAAAAAFVYKVYTVVAVKYHLPKIAAEDWRTGVDIIAYALMGVGIHSSFTGNKE